MKFQIVSIAACLSLINAQPFTESAITQKLASSKIVFQASVIDCSWPCPNPAHGCIVTNEGAHCATRGKDLWEITTPLKAPIYTGSYITRPMDSCQPAPIPNLPTGSATKPGQSVIMWPMKPERRPLDEYLGNCRGGLFCSSAGGDKSNPVCRIRYQPGVACVSPNQCYSGICTNNICQSGSNVDEAAVDDGNSSN